MTEARDARGRRPLWRLLVVAAVAVGLLGLDAGAAQADHNVEHTYEDPPQPGGGFPVAWDDGSPSGCVDPAPPPTNRPFTYVYPAANLGALGDHPIITWGNATNTSYGDSTSQRNSTCYYEEILSLFASWGFVVVAYNSGQTGSGNEMVWGAAELINMNNDEDSIFYQKLDTSSLAAAGHSQGAVGAINATLAGDGAFESVVTLSMPDRDDLEDYNDLCEGTPSCIQVPIPAPGATNDLDAPIFFARGSGLYLPPGHRCEDDDWMSDEMSEWYPAAPRPFLAGTVHVTPPMDLSLCDTGWPFDATYPHKVMADAYGYVNAWLAYTLQNQTGARPAFTGTSPQFMSNPDWEGRSIRGLT